ncbi:selenium cofactor biosynthesis protein YqeC [Vagococcus elongatus]|uniref:Hydroxylase n=1 Tax=Vagococcus elongatus TaxID=180344 RepID=A0A430AN01_9ENTE|nr:selenium cofactor biosynthesis protein YqeC [Vagococcus elongatus]RSU09343.1 hypothetical protein CBF29_11600 [Vagococcus elongatus]
MELKDCFGFDTKEIVAIIGSGGKTTTMEYLARSFPDERVLMGTTTKIKFPSKEKFDYYWEENHENQVAKDGVTLVGQINEVMGKFGSLPQARLTSLFKKFDKVFLEADGSKRLLLKGWKEFEPVIPEETTMTLGLIPITSLGLTIDEEHIHRLSELLKLTTANKGSVVTAKVLAQIITHSDGLFGKAKGKKVLGICQVDDEESFISAVTVAELLPKDFLEKLDRIVALSGQQGAGKIIWEK